MIQTKLEELIWTMKSYLEHIEWRIKRLEHDAGIGSEIREVFESGMISDGTCEEEAK